MTRHNLAIAALLGGLLVAGWLAGGREFTMPPEEWLCREDGGEWIRGECEEKDG